MDKENCLANIDVIEGDVNFVTCCKASWLFKAPTWLREISAKARTDLSHFSCATNPISDKDFRVLNASPDDTTLSINDFLSVDAYNFSKASFLNSNSANR